MFSVVAPPLASCLYTAFLSRYLWSCLRSRTPCVACTTSPSQDNAHSSPSPSSTPSSTTPVVPYPYPQASGGCGAAPDDATQSVKDNAGYICDGSDPRKNF